ncbi:epoxide hydrolase N-terminal domain-containing protein [Amycolatopsis decaplanina]|uniref:epoxide hydrolase N-terminal domain-containing protein n=1 Tax=Amycolatopsis decaplanina TaxID=208441 RepID=UPI003B82C8B2
MVGPPRQRRPPWTARPCSYWAEAYDWRAAESRLNAFPQCRTEIDGLGIRYLHGGDAGDDERVSSASPGTLTVSNVALGAHGRRRRQAGAAMAAQDRFAPAGRRGPQLTSVVGDHHGIIR